MRKYSPKQQAEIEKIKTGYKNNKSRLSFSDSDYVGWSNYMRDIEEKLRKYPDIFAKELNEVEDAKLNLERVVYFPVYLILEQIEKNPEILNDNSPIIRRVLENNPELSIPEKRKKLRGALDLLYKKSR